MTDALTAIWQRQIACRMAWPDVPLPPCAVSGREYVIGAQGVFVRAERPGLTALIPIAACVIARLGSVTPFVRLTVPRVPARLVTRLLRDARAARDETGQLAEMLGYFAWDEEDWNYLAPPEQIRRPASVHATLDDDAPVTRSIAHEALIEIHTHARLDPFFSATDQRDEQGGFRCYLVVGRLDREPTCLARVGVFGHFWPIPVATVLELPRDLCDAAPWGNEDRA